MGSNLRTGVAAIALLVFLIAGVSTSYWAGERLRATSHAEWTAKARLDAARLSDGVLFWISKAEVNLRAMAGMFGDLEQLSPEDFFRLVEEAEAWDPEIRFDSVVHATRLLKGERQIFEAAEGAPLRDASDPNASAAERFESFAVTHSSNPDGFLGLGVDLASVPEMREVATAARQLPGSVILGPAFKGDEGKTVALLATSSNLNGGDGVMAATINLHNFFEALGQSQLPPGIEVRLIERETETSENLISKPVIGGADPAPGTAITEVVRIVKGQARWSLNWDISHDYLGGPPENAVMLTQFGGGLVTLLLTLMFAYLGIENIRFHKLVNDKTAQLSQNSMIVQLTMDSIDQGFAVWNSDQRLVVWSKKCEEFWYYPGSKLRTGMHMRELLEHLRDAGAFGELVDEVDIDHELQKIAAAGGNSDDKFKMTDGRHVHVRRFPLERGGYVSVYTDVSEQAEQRVQLEDERARAVKANVVKTDFVMNLSHEMRDPLHSIIGFSDVILKSKAEPIGERTKSTVELINSTGRHMLELINGILDLSKLESGVVELDETTFELDEFLADITRMMAVKAGDSDTSLTVENKAGIGCKIIADRLMLRQVLINLVGNAIKFTPGGNVKIVADKDHGCLRITVEDNGVGIPPEDLPTITEMFKQARTNDPERHGGSGIGLTIAKRLAGLHNCEFDLESTLGQGTRVSMLFPKSRLNK